MAMPSVIAPTHRATRARAGEEGRDVGGEQQVDRDPRGEERHPVEQPAEDRCREQPHHGRDGDGQQHDRGRVGLDAVLRLGEVLDAQAASASGCRIPSASRRSVSAAAGGPRPSTRSGGAVASAPRRCRSAVADGMRRYNHARHVDARAPASTTIHHRSSRSRSQAPIAIANGAETATFITIPRPTRWPRSIGGKLRSYVNVISGIVELIAGQRDEGTDHEQRQRSGGGDDEADRGDERDHRRHRHRRAAAPSGERGDRRRERAVRIRRPRRSGPW